MFTLLDIALELKYVIILSATAGSNPVPWWVGMLKSLAKPSPYRSCHAGRGELGRILEHHDRTTDRYGSGRSMDRLRALIKLNYINTNKLVNSYSIGNW